MNIIISKRWAPIIGAALGYCVGEGAKVSGDNWIVWTTIIGTFIGVICLFVGKDTKDIADTTTIKDNRKASVVGIVLSISSLFLFFLPMGVGVAISATALAVNWRVKGAIKVLAWIGLVLSVLNLLLTCIMLLTMNLSAK